MENLKGVVRDFIKGNIASSFPDKLVKKYKQDVVVNFAAESHVGR